MKIKSVVAFGIVLVGLAGLSHGAFGQQPRQDRPVVHLGDRPIGSLGVPVGDYVTIEGVAVAGRLLNVDTLNGRKLETPVAITVEDIEPPPKEGRVVLKGYETLKMIGVPPGEEAAAREEHRELQLPQAVWQAYLSFVATSVISPKTLQLQRYESFDYLRSVRAGDDIGAAVRKELDNRPSVDSKVEFLASVISETTAVVNAANDRNADAINLLAKTGGTNAIGVLVSNILSFDNLHHNFPAADALCAIGEPAVPQLLKVFDDASNPYAMDEAAQTLARIKGKHYKEFVDEEKNSMSPAAWKRLSSASVAIFD